MAYSREFIELNIWMETLWRCGLISDETFSWHLMWICGA